MATAFLRPSAVSGSSVHWYTFGSPNNIVTNVADQSDVSMIMNQNTSGGGVPQTDSIIDYSLTDLPSLSGSYVITEVKVKCRWRWVDQGAVVPMSGDTSHQRKVALTLTLNSVAYTGYSAGVPTNFIEQTLISLNGPSIAPAAFLATFLNAATLRAGIGVDTFGGEQIDISDIWVEVTYDQLPTLDTPSPTGNITTDLRPTVSMVYHDADGDSLKAYQMKACTLQQLAIVGYNPALSESDYNTGIVSEVIANNTAISVPLPVDLRNGNAYRFYFRAQDSFGSWSAWAYASANMKVNTLAVPYIPTISPVSGDNSVSLTPQALDNIMAPNDSEFRFNGGSWTSDGTGTLLNHTSGDSVLIGTAFTAWDGSTKAITKVTANSATTVNVILPNGNIALAASRYYTFFTNVRSVDTNRLFQLKVECYNAANTLLTTFTSGNFQERTNSWINASITRFVPANTVSAKITISFIGCANAERHLFDGNGVIPGAYNIHSNGGFQLDVDANGIPDDWTAYYFPNGSGATGQAVVSLTEEEAYVGTKSVKMVFPSNFSSAGNAWAGITTTEYDFAAGEYYNWDIYIKCLSSTTDRPEFGIYLPNSTSWNTGGTFASPNWLVDINPADGYVDYTLTSDPRLKITTLNKWIKVSFQFKQYTANYQQSFFLRQVKPNITVYAGLSQVTNVNAYGTATPNIRIDNVTPGGYLTEQRLEIQRRSLIAGTWMDEWTTVDTMPYDVRTADISDTFQNVQVSDYFAIPGTTPYYRIRALGNNYLGNSISSVWSPAAAGNALPAIAKAWLKSSSDPSANLKVVNNLRHIVKDVQKQRTVHMPLSATKPIVVGGRRKSVSFPFAFICNTPDEQQKLETLLNKDETMLFQLPSQGSTTLGRQFWVQLNGNYAADEYIGYENDYEMGTIISGTFQEVQAPV